MSDTSTVLEDGSRLSRFDKHLFMLESHLNLVGGIMVFLLVFLAVANVLGRWIFDLPVSGYIDWVEQAMAFFAFLGIAYCQREGGHIRMDMFIGALRGRLLWVAELMSVVLMFGVTLMLIYGSFLHAWRAFDIGDSSFDIDLPVWPAKLVVPVALCFLAMRLFVQIWAYLRAIKEGSQHPIGVPLIEDAATQAAHEAKIVGQNGKAS